MIEHIKALSNLYDVSVVVNTQDADFLKESGLDVQIFLVPIRRDVAPWNDLSNVIKLIQLFREKDFDVIHSITPKAGLLAMLAGTVARISVRIHIFTGQVWVTRTGLSRQLIKFMDRLIALLATHVLADSHSQCKFLIDEKVVAERKINVLANGSICGVNTSRFRPNKKVRIKVRNELGVQDEDVVFLFLGRLKRDKGVIDLSKAFAILLGSYTDTHLIYVGPDEENLKSIIENCVKDISHLHFISYSGKPESYMAASDVLCLPSYREGFGNVIIEAAACGLPDIGSRIYGITDAIEEGKTGITFEVGNIEKLSELMYRFYSSQNLREEMGRDARIRAGKMFSAERVTEAWIDYYQTIQ